MMTEREPLPDRRAISAMSDLGSVLVLEDSVMAAATQIETDLEFRDGDDEWERRARGALTAHNICLKNIRKRIHALRGKGGGPDPTVVAAEHTARADVNAAMAAQAREANEKRRLALEQKKLAVAAMRETTIRKFYRIVEESDFGSAFIDEARDSLSIEAFAALIDGAKVRRAANIARNADPATLDALLEPLVGGE